MRPLFTVGVWLVVACHFVFLLYLAGGGFLAVALGRARRSTWSRRALAAHVAVVGWAVASVTADLWCPLTSLERWLRVRAGMAPLPPAGFIDHYLIGVILPSTGMGYVQAVVFAAVALSWIAYAADRPGATRRKGGDVGGLVPHRSVSHRLVSHGGRTREPGRPDTAVESR